MIGNGQFNFPFSYGHGGYLLVAPGGGLDIHFHRFTISAVDYEYQHWYNFQNSSLTPGWIQQRNWLPDFLAGAETRDLGHPPPTHFV
jgi:hypothetical protein